MLPPPLPKNSLKNEKELLFDVIVTPFVEEFGPAKPFCGRF
jgi:hypothetical protein